MSDKYYSHHVHLAEGSIGDSVLKMKEYVIRGVQYGLKSLTITDHGSLSAIYSFRNECEKHGIKPIIGMEAYECGDKTLKDKEHKKYNHLILIAKTDEGLRNLFTIHNRAAIEGFYYKPRTDMEDLRKYGRGIIGFSACVAGTIPQAIISGETEKCHTLIKSYKECFDEFYLELQPGNFSEQILVNDELVRLSRETSTPLVVTNDVHYLDASDYIVHDYHVKLNRKLKDTGGELCYPDTCYWFMDRDSLLKTFCLTELVTEAVISEALENAEKIAESSTAGLSSGMHMPQLPEVSKEKEEETLYELCSKELENVIQDKKNPEAYSDRLLYELDVIKRKGFSGYFLVVKDFLDYARRSGIAVGPGRGSAAGSLVGYLLNISQPDPIKYGLMFERFLDPMREAVPDIDSDFSVDPKCGRDRMFSYMTERYGYNNCALVSTLHMRKAKGAVRDAARVLGYEPSVGDEIAKLIPEVVYGDDGEKTKDLSVEDSVKIVPELNELSKKYPDIVNLAAKLEGLPNSAGIHAAGLLVSPIDMSAEIPLVLPTREGVLATSLDLDSAENLFIKYDFLGIASLDVIANTEKDVGWSFDYKDESLYEDKAVWDILGTRNTTGLFQVSSKTYKDRMPRLKPKNMEELGACLALIRGACIQTKMDEEYMQIVEGRREVRKVHPVFDDITRDTNGVVLYQEQVMLLAVRFGLSLSEGYRIVKAGAKKNLTELKNYREKFIGCCIERNVSGETAGKMFDLIEASASYSFNKSHAVSYGHLCYASAYMKVHYPLQYMKNLLSNAYSRGEKESYGAIVSDCRRLGIEFLPADINKSFWDFSCEEGKIRVGLCAVKGFGEKAAEQVLKCRPFSSLEDLLDKVEKRTFNKKVVNVAIFSGLLDELEGSRRETYEKFMAIREEEPQDEISLSKGYVIKITDSAEDLEKKIYGESFLEDPALLLKRFSYEEIRQGEDFTAEGYIRDIRVIKTKAGREMAFFKLASGCGTIECTLFPQQYRTSRKYLKEKALTKILARKENEESCTIRTVA